MFLYVWLSLKVENTEHMFCGVCLCLCVCCMWMYMCSYAGRGQRAMSGVFLSYSLPCSWRQGHSLHSVLIESVRQTSQWAPGICQSLRPDLDSQCWGNRCALLHSAFTWVLRMWTQALTLVQECYIDWASFPDETHSFLSLETAAELSSSLLSHRTLRHGKLK